MERTVMEGHKQLYAREFDNSGKTEPVPLKLQTAEAQ